MKADNNSDCIFCKIINEQVPAVVIFENDQFIVFNTNEPVTEGHALVVPKHHAETVTDMDAASLEGLGAALKQSAEIVTKAIDVTGFNILQANGADAQQSVFHAHFHIIPRRRDDGLDLWIRQGL